MATKLPKYKPIIKFNGGSGAILCNRCRVIIKTNLTKKEFEGKTQLVLCEECAKKEMDKALRKLEVNETKKNR